MSSPGIMEQAALLREPDTIWRNLRLITSPWNAFVFIVHPTISWLMIFYIISHLKEHEWLDPYVSGEVRFTAAIFYFVFAVLFLGLYTSDIIEEDLKRRGYVQKKCLQRGLYPWLGLGCCALVVWGPEKTYPSFKDLELTFPQFIAYMIFVVTASWASLLFGMLGSIVLLTERVEKHGSLDETTSLLTKSEHGP